MRFELGEIVATPQALELLTEGGIDPLQLLQRHGNGDWGDLDDEDKAANEEALMSGARLFSAYEFSNGKLWIITEATNDQGSRASTCILTPAEY